MYCHNFHVVLSDGDFFFAWSSMSCAWVMSHMMTMSPNLISLFHRDLFYVLGDVCFYSVVSRWVTCYVVASPFWHDVIGSLVDYSFVFRTFFFDSKIPPVYEHRGPPQQPGLPLALCTAVATTYGSASVGALQNTSLQYFVCFEFILYHWKPLQSIINACLEWFVPCFFAFYFWILLSLLY